MLNTNLAIAVKNKCSRYQVKKISIFELNNIQNKFTSLEAIIKDETVMIKIKCPLCEQIHNYSYIVSDLVRKDILIAGCEVLNVPLFFIGEENEVINRVNRYECINKELYKIMIK